LSGKETTTNSVTFDHITAEILDHVLRFIYYEDFEANTITKVIDVGVSADYLQLQDLKQKCVAALKTLFPAASSNDRAIVLSKITENTGFLDKEEANLLWKQFVERANECTNLKDMPVAFIKDLVTRFSSRPCDCYRWLVKWSDIQPDTSIELPPKEKLPYKYYRWFVESVGISPSTKLDPNEQQLRHEIATDLVRKLNFRSVCLEDLVDLSAFPLLPPADILKLMRNNINSPNVFTIQLEFTENEEKTFQFRNRLWTFKCKFFGSYYYSEARDIFEIAPGEIFPDNRIEVLTSVALKDGNLVWKGFSAKETNTIRLEPLKALKGKITFKVQIGLKKRMANQ
jgi:hypothetical protein